ncbi:MAG: hypothetical protein WD055_04025 [Candidatus Dependentiae bacterium]
MNKQMLILLVSTAATYPADNSQIRLSSSEEFYQCLSGQPIQNQEKIEQKVQESLHISTQLIKEAEKDPLVTAFLQLANNPCETESENKASWVVFGTTLHLKVKEIIK